MKCGVCDIAGHSRKNCPSIIKPVAEQETVPVVVVEEPAPAPAPAPVLVVEEPPIIQWGLWNGPKPVVSIYTPPPPSALPPPSSITQPFSYIAPADPICADNFKFFMTTWSLSWRYDELHVIWEGIRAQYKLDPTKFKVNGTFHSGDDERMYYTARHHIKENGYNTLHIYGARHFDKFRVSEVSYRNKTGSINWMFNFKRDPFAGA